MTSVSVSNLSLVLAFGLVLLAVGLSAKEKLGLGKEIAIAVVRTVIQLVVVGFVLQYIFRVNNILLTVAMVMVIIFNASRQAHSRNPNSNKHLWQSWLAILLSTTITLGILIASGAIKVIPSQIIPISGMIASNSMVAIGLSYRAVYSLFTDQRQQVLEKLALGAPVKMASLSILRQAIKTGVQPTVDSAKTVGLVSLPGMMSGLMFAGVDPVYAIKYQIMVMFMLLSATSLGSVIASYFAYKTYFNERMQLEF
ncbi:ABC transporter permease [Streptococcus halotolerans]|uniref:ABC transporter permease n=1 Tax=Streptococcus halotolerans TaxID=1814128 RepID=UPI000787A9AA|nr:iron export ABC transporter permease subunit FetB [Streptococcus halotolerans]